MPDQGAQTGTVLDHRVKAHLDRGLALKAAHRLDEAGREFDGALRIAPDCVPALVNRAAISQLTGEQAAALAFSERAIALAPDLPAAHVNRGLALFGLDRPVEALESYDRALALDADFVPAHGNRGKVLQALDRPEEALLAYDHVIARKPDAAQAYVNAGHTLLSLGDFARGWPLYEWRKKLPQPIGNRWFAKTAASNDTPLAGRRLLLHWEQGLGDTLQFCRYGPLAAGRGAAVTLMVQPRLERLMTSLRGAAQGSTIRVLSAEPPPEEFDYHCPLLSAPQVCGTRLLEQIPCDTPYLFAEPARVARWRERLGAAGFKIGISWQGNRHSPADRGRSFSVELFRHLASVPGVRLISLQSGDGTEQLETLPPGMHVETLGPEVDVSDAFVDSAAIMQNLDLVITSDTAMAHLAGALARPAWVALPQVADWRWLRQRSDSPWYPTLRLFRQRRAGDWDEVFERMRAELKW